MTRPWPIPSLIEEPSGLELAVLVPVVERRTHRVGRHDPHLGVALLEEQADAGQRAARADGAGEGVDLAVGLLPDLRAGGAVVAHPVGDIVELVGPDRPVGLAPVQLLGEPAGQLHVVVRVLVGHGRHRAQIGAHQPQHVHLLLALRLGDDDHGAVAAHVADQRQADPGVAGRALDDRPAGPQQALLLGVGDDRQRRPVLDAAARVEELALAQDLAARGVGDLVEAHQRRVADQIDEVLANVHAAPCDHWPGSRS